MRRSAALLLVLLLAASCSSGPLPTLEDYTYGASAVVTALVPLFTEGRGVAADRLAGTGSASPLEDLASRWVRATKPDRRADLRIVDFLKPKRNRATFEIEVRLTGFSSATEGERLSGHARFVLTAVRENGSAPWKLAESRSASGSAPFLHGKPHLVENARGRGLVATHEPIDPVEKTNFCIPATRHRPGVLLVDVDGDGALDVVLPDRLPHLFRNDGRGRFRDATKGSGLDLIPPGEASGGVAADLDGDGLPDLFLTYHHDPCRLLKNEGNGRFRDVTTAWGLAGLVGPYTSAAFFDADRDGRLDLYLCCYGDARKSGPAYDGFNGEHDRFFHNRGAGSAPFFVDATTASGLVNPGWGFAVSACDFDDDGDDDLYVANDFGINCLFLNDSTPGHPRFVDIARSSGTEDEGYGMGATWGDYDGDGKWDLHVTDYFTPYRWILRDRRWPMPPMPGASLVRGTMARKMARRSRGDALFHNLGGHVFERVSETAGVEDGGWAWGTEFVDLDGKGREDLLVVNGMYRATTGRDDEIAFWNGMGREGVNFHDGVWGGIDFGANGMASHTPKKLFWNRGDGTFEERAFVEGFDTLDDTRGLAYGDLDGDGAPEVVVSCFRQPPLLYENRWGKESGGRIRVLLGAASGTNRDAIGTVVRLKANGKTQLREVRAGSSYLSQSSRELLFGVGGASGADRLDVRWPDGRREAIADVPAGSRVVWLEGKKPEVLTGEKASSLLPR